MSEIRDGFEIEVTFRLYPQSTNYHAFVIVSSHDGYNKLHGESKHSFFNAPRRALISGIPMLLPAMTTDDLEEWSAHFSNEAHSEQDKPFYISGEVDHLFEMSEMLDEEVERRRNAEPLSFSRLMDEAGIPLADNRSWED